MFQCRYFLRFNLGCLACPFPTLCQLWPNWHISNLAIYLTSIISLAHLRAWANDFIPWWPMLYIIQIVYIQLTVDMFLCPYFAATWKMWKCLRNNITWPLSYVTHFWKAMKGRQISLQVSSVYLYMVKHRYSAKLHKGTNFLWLVPEGQVQKLFVKNIPGSSWVIGNR